MQSRLATREGRGSRSHEIHPLDPLLCQIWWLYVKPYECTQGYPKCFAPLGPIPLNGARSTLCKLSPPFDGFPRQNWWLCLKREKKLFSFIHSFIYITPKLECRCQAGFLARKFDHTTSLLCELHWLKVPERIKLRLCVLTHRCLHDMAPCYLAETIHPVSSCALRRHLRSADTSQLIVPPTRRSTIGDRAFPVAAAIAWNSLPPFLRDAPSHVAFRRKIKTFLFRSSFPTQ